jgi:hypothetical protein
MSVPTSEKLAERAVLVPIVPPGPVLGTNTTIPTPATNVAAAMRMAGRRYEVEWSSSRKFTSNTFRVMASLSVRIRRAHATVASTYPKSSHRVQRGHA